MITFHSLYGSPCSSEEIVQKYDMNHVTGLRYRLKAVSDHNHPVRELGVQHRVGAKVVKTKMMKNCKECCCANHCRLTGHDKNDMSLDNYKDTAMEHKFPAMLDKSWNEFEDTSSSSSCLFNVLLVIQIMYMFIG